MKKKKRECKGHRKYNGYCNHHTDQDLTGRPTCIALNTRGVRCMMPKEGKYENQCILHSWHSAYSSVRYWSIFNDKEIVISPTIQHAEIYLEKHENSNVFPQTWCKKYETYLEKEVSLTKMDVLIDLINEFIGIDYIWIAIGKLFQFGSLAIHVVGTDCKTELGDASMYCVKIGKVYKRSNLESQKIIT
uniref:Zn-finger protein n=1 Tax=Pithovirus LCPAC401 TaxID=2506595 RepID=A0A481ZDU3_9VIRU|nr:MAG: Zn-finger protein [Pithovirus LCPAC401]